MYFSLQLESIQTKPWESLQSHLIWPPLLGTLHLNYFTYLYCEYVTDLASMVSDRALCLCLTSSASFDTLAFISVTLPFSAVPTSIVRPWEMLSEACVKVINCACFSDISLFKACKSRCTWIWRTHWIYHPRLSFSYKFNMLLWVVVNNTKPTSMLPWKKNRNSSWQKYIVVIT